MTDIVLQPGNVRVLSVTMLTPWLGVPVLDCELDPDTLKVPTGKVTLTIAGTDFQGTVDPRGSGQFVEFVHVRVLLGGGGWDKTVDRQWYASDSGITSELVITQTAQEVGESALVPAPVTYPARFVRSMGPASRVLEGFEWWVGADGVTRVGTRPTFAADKSVTLLRYDPTMQLAEMTSDVVVLPGSILSDPRIKGGSVTVRDVEQVFDGQGSRVKAWCGVSPVSQLMNDLRALIVKFSGRTYLATYEYRIVEQNAEDGRLQLQIVRPADGMPDTLPVSPWMGPGDSAKFTPGSLVRLAFFAADPSQPIVDSYQPGVLPLERTIDAEAVVHVGPSATNVELAGGHTPLVPTPWATSLTIALEALATSLAAFTTGPLAPLGAIGTTLGMQLAALPADATTRVTAQ